MGDDIEAIRSRTDRIRTTADGFCKAFMAGNRPSDILDKYFASNATILEHGPIWANEKLPFLGITFEGRSSGADPKSTSDRTCDDYYDLLTSTLSFYPNKDAAPPKEDFMIDPYRQSVTIKLHGQFASVKTGKSWEEDFVYVLSEFDCDGRIGRQELWADPLSAWVAVQEA